MSALALEPRVWTAGPGFFSLVQREAGPFDTAPLHGVLTLHKRDADSSSAGSYDITCYESGCVGTETKCEGNGSSASCVYYRVSCLTTSCSHSYPSAHYYADASPLAQGTTAGAFVSTKGVVGGGGGSTMGGSGYTSTMGGGGYTSTMGYNVASTSHRHTKPTHTSGGGNGGNGNGNGGGSSNTGNGGGGGNGNGNGSNGSNGNGNGGNGSNSTSAGSVKVILTLHGKCLTNYSDCQLRSPCPCCALGYSAISLSESKWLGYVWLLVYLNAGTSEINRVDDTSQPHPFNRMLDRVRTTSMKLRISSC